MTPISSFIVGANNRVLTQLRVTLHCLSPFTVGSAYFWHGVSTIRHDLPIQTDSLLLFHWQLLVHFLVSTFYVFVLCVGIGGGAGGTGGHRPPMTGLGGTMHSGPPNSDTSGQ